jgi:hypothetical protein
MKRSKSDARVITIQREQYGGSSIYRHGTQPG